MTVMLDRKIIHLPMLCLTVGSTMLAELIRSVRMR